MSEHEDNLIPEEYWNEVSQEEMEALQKAADEANEYLEQPIDEWDEMDDTYFEALREKFKKGKDEIGQRQFKTFMNRSIPIWMMVMPAGRQHDGEKMVQYFHTITEDMESGECNGSYELITETDLEEKFNIKYNN